ncbi:M20/M25/M40 family metallo-hydrolase [Glacieibacterium megasporae]|uniref:M20/M25/M40 family metallo-hydrolase n=1 Tax=Glacieibacterium megasporae TaxID=2835787 RepID=UPI001C1DF944|nr:M20/M25/M40 family metallo-hydrolase [Polymorphobacter megasporae]UAJ09163.1 M20/M25/M40 family metallo-hydrolase [Polymorphobacter megasporae]
MRDYWALFLAVIGAALFAVLATTPPGPRGVDTPAADFSAERAMSDVQEIGRAPHPSGSADNARVRAWLIERLRGLGLSVRTTVNPMSAKGAKGLAKWSGDATVRPVVNIVATLPGRDRTAPALVLMAHYDSVWGSPGAADDGAGVASIIEIVRALKAGPPPRRDVIVLLTDGEELGLEGARAFFRTDPERARPGVIVNFETRGGGGRAAMFETGHDNGGMMRLFASTVGHPSATSLSVLIYELLPNDTDYTPAKALGIPGFNFAFIGRSGFYHSPLATPANLDRGALQDMGAQGLDIARALATVPALPHNAPSLVFFDAFSSFLMIYPAAVGWAILGVAALILTAAALRGKARPRDLGRGVAALVVLIVVAGGALYLVNLVSGADGKVNYYDRLAAIPRLQLQALLLCTAALSAVAALFRRSPDGIGTWLGVTIPLLIAGVAVQIIAPTAAFIIAWPVLLAGIAAATAAFAPRFGTAATVAAAAVGVGYLVGFGFFLMQGIGPTMPVAAAIPLAASAILLWPLLPSGRQVNWVVAAALLVAAIAIALSVRLDPIAASVATYSLHH